jgi:GT2 family glycosyltransferase
VSLGRNRLLEACDTDYAVFIDDDAVALGPLSDAVARRFDADPDLAVLAFAIQRPDHDVSLEYPFRGSRPADDTAERPCAYFVGAGYAVRVAAVRSVDGYDESFFYSNEEIDLSMRLLHAGWSLRYVPGLRVEHRPSTRGRNTSTTVSGMVLANRLVYARRHLPAPVRQIHETVWMLRTLPDALRARALGTWARSLREGLRRPVTPRPLAWRRLREIHHLGGRVLF